MSENTSDPWAEVTDSVTSSDRGDSSEKRGGAETSETSETSGSPDAAESSRSAPSTGVSEAKVPGPADSDPDTTASEAEYTDARRVLDAVAEGRLTPEQASRLLDELGGSRVGQSEPSSEERIRVGEPTRATVDRVRIRAVGRRVRLIGEPFVSTVAVDGPHVVRQEGNTLVVTSEGEFGASLDGFTLTPPRSFRDVQQKFMELGRELAIRVNPELIVESEITAGSLNAERLPRLETVRATAGSVRVRDIDGPLDLLVQAGSAQVEGRLHKGHSRFRTESGSLQLRLLKDSSVRIRQDAQLGRVLWDAGEADEYVIGGGNAQLDLEVVMAQATVKEAR